MTRFQIEAGAVTKAEREADEQQQAEYFQQAAMLAEIEAEQMARDLDAMPVEHYTEADVEYLAREAAKMARRDRRARKALDKVRARFGR